MSSTLLFLTAGIKQAVGRWLPMA